MPTHTNLNAWITNRETSLNRPQLNPSLLLPTKLSFAIDRNSRIYSSQFSANGEYCYISTQDHKVIFYDTTDPAEYKQIFEFQAAVGQWTTTDFTISPNSKFLAYSSLVPYVHLAQISKDGKNLSQGKQIILDFTEGDPSSFAIWSLKFSANGRELIAGTNDCSIFVYDIERREVLHEIQGHSNDVNSVGFVDPLDPNVLVSGSDDHLIKIWDRRSLGAACIPSGVLIGHTEGITYVSPKGDGRHILSNGKDQAMKLWDIRRMASGSKKDYSETIDYCPPWDYRWMKYPLKSPLKHPKDCSVKTFVGHSVLKTLIRCHFSPCSNYTYTGSADGIIHIYSLQGNEKHRINTNSVKFGRSRHARDSRGLVRDVSWHPNAPYLICGQWLEDGGRLLKYDPAFE